MQWTAIITLAIGVIGSFASIVVSLLRINTQFTEMRSAVGHIVKQVDEIKDSLTDVDKEVRQTQHRVVALETRIALPSQLNGAGH